ncbi:EAL domain-containing protein [Gallaecimonas sp. GXIMD4217]|uniref:EAL domain-containing protein n=1 Tax=Gallaecimonas sp. GXIMD4217 TaxID=3131927 RepID=UPI00311AF42C
MIWRTLMLGLVLLGGSGRSLAHHDYSIRQWTAQQGLTDGQVQVLAEDKHGAIWAGTASGLFRLSQSSAMRIDLPGQHGLKDGAVYALQALDDGRLLVGFGDGLYLYEPAEDRFHKVGENGLLSGFKGLATTLFRDNLGRIWAPTAEGPVYRLHLELNQASEVPVLRQEDTWFAGAAVGANILLLGVRNISLYSERFEGRIDLSWDEARHGQLKDIYVDDRDRVWASSSRGLFQLSILADRIDVQPRIEGTYFRQIIADGQGGLWLTGRYGVLHYDVARDRLTDYYQRIWQETGAEGMLPLLLDSKQRIWAGAEGEGVIMLAEHPLGEVERYTRHTEPALSSDMIWGIWTEGDERWLATEAGLEWLHKGGEHRLYRPKDFTSNDGFYLVTPLDDRHFLVGGLRGLYRFDKTDKRFTRLLTDQPYGEGSVFFAKKLAEDTWVGLEGGLLRQSPGQTQFFQFDSQGRHLEGIKQVSRSPGGQIWVAGFKGLYRLREQQLEPVGLGDGGKDGVSALLWLGERELLVGREDDGVVKLTLDDGGNVVERQQMEPLWGMDINSVYFLQRYRNWLFIGQPSSLAKVDLDSGSSERFFQDDGLPDDELNEGAAHVGSDGMLYIGTPKGLLGVRPEQLVRAQAPSEAGLIALTAQFEDGRQRRYLEFEDDIALASDLSLLQLTLGSFDYESTRQPLSRYQIKPVHREPIEILGEQPVNFSALHPGRHELLVWSQQRGVWRSQPQRLTIEVAPPWFETTWFYLAVAALSLGLILILAWVRWRQQSAIRSVHRAMAESEQRLRFALLGSNSDMWDWHARDNKFALHSLKGKLAGRPGVVRMAPEEIPIHPDDRERIYQVWLDHLEGRAEQYDVEYRIILDGKPVWYHVTGSVVERDAQGRPVRIAGIYHDISARKALEDELTLFARAFETTSEGVLILDSDHKISGGNPAVETITGFKRDLLSGCDFKVLIKDERGTTSSYLWAEVENRGTWTGEILLHNADGSQCPAWLNLSAMRSDNLITHYVAVFSDMTERKRTESELRRLANYDVLTGLPNRALFVQRLRKVIQDAHNRGRQAALLFMDLDRFKTVNDSYGHNVGDALLVEAANRLRDSVSEQDMVARLGGDEFVIIVHDAEDAELLSHLCERLLASFVEPFSLFGRDFYISTSIGISLFPDDGSEPEVLLKNADMAMYHAKEEGRNNYQFYSDERTKHAMLMVRLESELRKALDGDQLQVYFQPQVDVLDQDKVVAMEALVRWHHPKEGFIPPDRFIKVAENSGQIVALDNWVMGQACAQAKQLNDELDQPVAISVNVSALHFRQPDYVEQVRTILDQTGLAPELLTLELTESTLMQEVVVAKEHLLALHELGVSLAVDDFGTGYSSLAYLKQFKVNELKVDKSFVRDLGVDETDAAIVRSIVDMARNLGLRVVAEGVETEQHLEHCMALGCYRVQGYYFARPMPMAELKQWLRQERDRSVG